MTDSNKISCSFFNQLSIHDLERSVPQTSPEKIENRLLPQRRPNFIHDLSHLAHCCSERHLKSMDKHCVKNLLARPGRPNPFELPRVLGAVSPFHRANSYACQTCRPIQLGDTSKSKAAKSFPIPFSLRSNLRLKPKASAISGGMKAALRCQLKISERTVT